MNRTFVEIKHALSRGNRSFTTEEIELYLLVRRNIKKDIAEMIAKYGNDYASATYDLEMEALYGKKKFEEL